MWFAFTSRTRTARYRNVARLDLNRLYPWQKECLATPGVLEGRNLVYSAPTSGGKTLVSELLILRRVLQDKRKAILVLPYVSVVTEKQRSLQKLGRALGLHVAAFYGGSKESFKDAFDIGVCTVEKGNQLVTSPLAFPAQFSSEDASLGSDGPTETLNARFV